MSLDVYVKGPRPMVRFTGDSFVLPSTARRGIPIVSVNTESAKLKLYRIGDRNISSLLTSSQFLTQLDGYSEERIKDESGELVWQGSIDIATELNKEVVTSFPVDEALPQRKPGVYVLTASSGTGLTQDWDARATQWFVVSDIGISTFAGTDGLTVFARSLASAKPLAEVELQLVAKNNEVLGTATTDAEGRATFSAGLIRGTASMTPAAITARKGSDDYVFLDMTARRLRPFRPRRHRTRRTGCDRRLRLDGTRHLSRGRKPSCRSAHPRRQRCRDREVATDLRFPAPRTASRTAASSSDGGKHRGHTLRSAGPRNAMRGTLDDADITDPKGSAIAEKQFLVDDFVPDRTEFDLRARQRRSRSAPPSKSPSTDVPLRATRRGPDAGRRNCRQADARSEAFNGYFFASPTKRQARTSACRWKVWSRSMKTARRFFDVI